MIKVLQIVIVRFNYEDYYVGRRADSAKVLFNHRVAVLVFTPSSAFV